MQRKLQNERGFTLVELLAVMAVFTIIGSVIGGILISSLRNATKATAITVVKQNGNFAISQIAKVLRDARVLESPFPCSTPDNPTIVSQVQVITNTGLPVTLDCQAPTSDSPPVTTIASNSSSLLDTSAVSLASCTFYCSQATPSDFPVISIDFFLNTRTNSSFAEQSASASAAEFNTSVTLRNINR